MNVAADHPLAVAVIHAIREGEVSSLKRLLEEPPGLASARRLPMRRRWGWWNASKRTLRLDHLPRLTRSTMPSGMPVMAGSKPSLNSSWQRGCAPGERNPRPASRPKQWGRIYIIDIVTPAAN